MARKLKPTHAVVKRYYETLKRLGDQGLDNEGNLRNALERLLEETAAGGWSWVMERSEKVSGHRIVPDGTLLDGYYQPRGYWEAKDTKDDLDAEIASKKERGYPVENTIFEDTRQAVLYQNGFEIQRYAIDEPKQLCDLLNDFYDYVLPFIGNFEKAVDEFKGRVAELGGGLQKKVAEAHRDNRAFEEALERFFELTKSLFPCWA